MIENPTNTYAAIIVNRKIAAVDKVFYYVVPSELYSEISCGSIVSIPFGREQLEGVVVDLTTELPADLPPNIKMRAISGLVSPRPLFNEDLLSLSRWMADYYMCPWVTVLQSFLPAGWRLTGRLPQRALKKEFYASDLSTKTKVTPKQQKVLDYLKIHEGATAKEILDAGFSSYMLANMRQKGLVEMRERLDFGEGQAVFGQKSRLNAEQEQV